MYGQFVCATIVQLVLMLLQIATISPGFSCCEHTLNTLRYAARSAGDSSWVGGCYNVVNTGLKTSLVKEGVVAPTVNLFQ